MYNVQLRYFLVKKVGHVKSTPYSWVYNTFTVIDSIYNLIYKKTKQHIIFKFILDHSVHVKFPY